MVENKNQIKNKGIFCFCIFLIFIFLVSQVNADDIRYFLQERLEHGHVLHIKNINTDPYPIPPGSPASLNLKIENTGTNVIKDIRLTLFLPSQFTTFNDLTQRKIAKLDGGESKQIEFNIIALPNAEEGIYDVSIYFDYVNPVGTEIRENGTIGLALSDIPQVFIEVDSSEIYKGNKIGEVTLKLINNGLANIRFLTVKLESSEDYEILSAEREYVGDLDSDDFEEVDFRLKIKTNEEKIELPLSLDYRDSLNREYNKKINVFLHMRSAGELGLGQDYTLLIFIVIGIVIIVGYVVYKRRKRKKNAKRLH